MVCDWQNGVARSGAGSEAAVGAEGKSWESLCAGWWDLGALEREGAELGGVQGLMDMVLRLLLHCCPVLNVGLTSAFFEWFIYYGQPLERVAWILKFLGVFSSLPP